MYFSPRFSKKGMGAWEPGYAKWVGIQFFFFFLPLCFSLSFIPGSEISVRKVIFPSCGREGSVKFRWVISEGWDSYSLQTPTKRERTHRLWSFIHGCSTEKPSKIFSMCQWGRFLPFINTSQAFYTCRSGPLGFPITALVLSSLCHLLFLRRMPC